MDLDKGGQRFVKDKGDVVQQQIDEADEKVHVDLRLFVQLLAVNGVGPDAFDNLEDFVSDVELLEELVVCSRGLDFDVELHQPM